MDSQADLAHILEPSAWQGKPMKMSWACTAPSTPSHAGAVVTGWSLMGPGERHRQTGGSGRGHLPRLPGDATTSGSLKPTFFQKPVPAASHPCWDTLPLSLTQAQPVKWPLQPASGSLSSHQSPCPVGSLSETSFFPLPLTPPWVKLPLSHQRRHQLHLAHC